MKVANTVEWHGLNAKQSLLCTRLNIEQKVNKNTRRLLFWSDFQKREGMSWEQNVVKRYLWFTLGRQAVLQVDFVYFLSTKEVHVVSQELVRDHQSQPQSQKSATPQGAITFEYERPPPLTPVIGKRHGTSLTEKFKTYNTNPTLIPLSPAALPPSASIHTTKRAL